MQVSPTLGEAGAAVAGVEAPPAPPSAAAQPPAPPSAPRTLHLAKGTELEIELVDALSSKTSKLGEAFAIRLATPISQDGAVVVAAGAVGRGEIIDAAKSGFNGKPGKLIISVRELDLNGVKARVRGMSLATAGTNRTNNAVAGMILFGVAASLVHGGDIEMAPGMKGLVRLSDDIDVPLAVLASLNGEAVK